MLFGAPSIKGSFLRALARRWADLSRSAVRRIERRLLQGPPRLDREEEAQYVERRSASSLNRIHWLASQGCSFHFDVDAETARLRTQVAGWQPRDPTADSTQVKGGWVQTDTEYGASGGARRDAPPKSFGTEQ
jgi:hypothetical protein